MKSLDLSKLTKRLQENKYVFLIAFLGLVLLLLPGKSTKESGTDYALTASAPAGGKGDPLESSGIPLDTESERLGDFLSDISGVGEVHVLLSREGAVIVCTGADDAGVQLKVTNAVSAYTGLGSDKIRVMKMK